MSDKSAFFRTTAKSLVPAEKGAEEMLAAAGRDALVRVTITKPRRPKHHRWFFVTVSNFFENWPDTHEFQPDNEGHLRAWATCKAKYRDLLYYDGETIDQLMDFITACMTRTGQRGYGFLTRHGGKIVHITPKSIAFKELDQTAFTPIADSILDVLEAESGLTVASMMSEAA